METVEIDPELFITCRICLNEKGSYQITPVLQEQINYCLDAVVQPFDGFSQVICKKCKPVLHCFYNLKKNFKDNQNNLKKNTNVNVITKEQADQYVVTSSQQEENIENSNLKVTIKKVLPASKEILAISCTSSDSESNTDSLNKQGPINIVTKPENDWETKYQKYFVCRYCDQHCKSLLLIIQHLETHKKLLTNYKKYIPKHCNVSLNRTDNNPNYTGKVTDTNIVVLDMKTFIHDGNNINFYITFLPKVFKSESDNIINEVSSDDEPKGKVNSKQSSDDETIAPIKTRKRARFLSDSEDTSTVSYGSDLNDKSDDSKTETLPQKRKKYKSSFIINPQLTDSHKAHILNIVLGSYKKSVNKLNSNKINLGENLNRKILGIGRKVMSKVGMPSPGLLKYLEYKNLSIEWTPNNSSSSLGWKENDYVRIMTNIKEKPQPDNFVYLDEIKNNYLLNDTNSIELKEMLTDTNIYEEPIHNATITKTTNDNVILKTYLLNPCPVANPKQAPQKKLVVKTVQGHNNSTSSNSELICLNDSDEDKTPDIMSQLPIITSTTSLAPNANTNVGVVKQLLDSGSITPNTFTDTANKQNEPVGVDQPRIKCKPVSELMATNTLTHLNPPPLYYSVVDQQKTPINSGINKPPTVHTPTVLNGPTPQTSGVTKTAGISNTIPTAVTPPLVNEYITLDTGLMPNTSTSSPITYFQNVLQSYGLELFDSLSDCRSLCCLIKFKLNIKHDLQSVLLNLSLFASSKSFCIKVKNGNSDFINIAQMSANWQWELIRAFQDNVVLEKAQNTSNSQKASEFTELFISILKSIKKIENH